MGGRETAVENKRFGRYLRRVRERRKLSLDAVEEMSLGYPERITKSHLSRIENGQAIPTFPRMFALSQIYGVPIASVAERFETELRLEMNAAQTTCDTLEEVLEELERHKTSGRYSDALSLVTAALDRFGGMPDERIDRGSLHELRLYHINCLVHLQRYETAKVECEKLLNSDDLSRRQHLWALLSYITCCYRLRRYTIAAMALEQADRYLDREESTPRLRGVTETVRGPVYFAMGRIAEAAAAFERAVEIFRAVSDSFEACKARVNLGQALIELGEPAKARAHLRQALRVAEESSYDKLGALALSHLAVVAHRQGETDVAEAYALRSNAVARPREYLSIVFRNCYYLREIAVERGDGAAARSYERTLKATLGRVDSDLPEAERYRAHLAEESP